MIENIHELFYSSAKEKEKLLFELESLENEPEVKVIATTNKTIPQIDRLFSEKVFIQYQDRESVQELLKNNDIWHYLRETENNFEIFNKHYYNLKINKENNRGVEEREPNFNGMEEYQKAAFLLIYSFIIKKMMFYLRLLKLLKY